MNLWNNIKTEKFDTADEFVSALVRVAGESFIFRGQGCANWSLKPSSRRVPHFEEIRVQMKKARFGNEPAIWDEMSALNAFASACDSSGLRIAGDCKELRQELEDRLLIAEDGGRIDPFMWTNAWPGRAEYRFQFMAQAQHHGIATRLLDWSKSPLVAAFFAVQQLIEDLKDKVYQDKDRDLPETVNSRQLAVILLDVQGARLWRDSFSVRAVPGFTSHNIAPQQGVFTFIQGFEVQDLDILNLQHCERFLRRYTISIHHAKAVYMKCFHLGICAATMFPGYEGAVRQANSLRILQALDQCIIDCLAH
ncbi:FRG domain-containing protein [Thalassospira sp.]|uniref:FRG domain-containing protein n=1 Tax=Thalassospira sp. TaxID=1912094 RepID=UPI001B1F87B5|nr:FRG domain-containing protein [Thalassospira sp.]MBO6805734.1 FRG domain-containing protein [Thalassospira sp.]MBO6841348.1 FRG domain-containing protein [Thalassospira sp.]